MTDKTQQLVERLKKWATSRREMSDRYPSHVRLREEAEILEQAIAALEASPDSNAAEVGE